MLEDLGRTRELPLRPVPGIGDAASLDAGLVPLPEGVHQLFPALVEQPLLLLDGLARSRELGSGRPTTRLRGGRRGLRRGCAVAPWLGALRREALLFRQGRPQLALQLRDLALRRAPAPGRLLEVAALFERDAPGLGRRAGVAARVLFQLRDVPAAALAPLGFDEVDREDGLGWQRWAVPLCGQIVDQDARSGATAAGPGLWSVGRSGLLRHLSSRGECRQKRPRNLIDARLIRSIERPRSGIRVDSVPEHRAPMTTEAPKGRRFLVRSTDLAHRLDVFLVAAIASVVVNRVFLVITGYPQIGNGTLHISHAIWGGLMMAIAIIIAVTYIAPVMRGVVAVLGGIGFGFFVDELGKFITRDVNYFFRPTFSLIYLTFVAMFLAFRTIERKNFGPNEGVLNALEALKAAALGRLDEPRREAVLELLGSTNPHGGLADGITALLAEVPVLAPQEPGWSARVAQRARAWYYRWTTRPSFVVTVDTLFLIRAAILVAITAKIVADGAGIRGFGEWMTAISVAITTLLIVVGACWLPFSRERAYRWFDWGLLFNLLITQIFVFEQEQLRRHDQPGRGAPVLGAPALGDGRRAGTRARSGDPRDDTRIRRRRRRAAASAAHGQVDALRPRRARGVGRGDGLRRRTAGPRGTHGGGGTRGLRLRRARPHGADDGMRRLLRRRVRVDRAAGADLPRVRRADRHLRAHSTSSFLPGAVSSSRLRRTRRSSKSSRSPVGKLSPPR